MGYVGLLAVVFMLLSPLIVALRCGWRNRGDRRGDLLLGLGATLLTVYLHSFFEWIFVVFPAQYLFAITVGMIAGQAQRLGYWGAPIRQRIVSEANASTANRSSASLPKVGLR
jgi:O-antigen ligase